MATARGKANGADKPGAPSAADTSPATFAAVLKSWPQIRHANTAHAPLTPAKTRLVPSNPSLGMKKKTASKRPAIAPAVLAAYTRPSG